jgi:hypothetical protein
MENILRQLMRVVAVRMAGDMECEEMWKLEELLDDYIDKRIEKRLDQEFSRGDYSTW